QVGPPAGGHVILPDRPILKYRSASRILHRDQVDRNSVEYAGGRACFLNGEPVDAESSLRILEIIHSLSGRKIPAWPPYHALLRKNLNHSVGRFYSIGRCLRSSLEHFDRLHVVGVDVVDEGDFGRAERLVD